MSVVRHLLILLVGAFGVALLPLSVNGVQAQLRDSAPASESSVLADSSSAVVGDPARQDVSRRPVQIREVLGARPDGSLSSLSGKPVARLPAVPSGGRQGRADRHPLLRPDRLSPGQNLLWGTVGLTLSLFYESEPRGRWRARGGRGPTWTPAPQRLHRPPPPPGCHACDPVRRRSMHALAEGLFRIGSYTRLK